MALFGDRRTLRFAEFVLDVAAYELRRNGRRVRLERQPMDLLILLAGRRGELVSRSEIVDALWAKDVFVDVENGVNTAIRKLRQALRDAPDAPRFIETVLGKGYRFIAAVEILQDAGALPLPPAAAPPSVVVDAQTSAGGAETSASGASVAVPDPGVGERAAGRRASARLVLGALTLAALAGALLWAWRPRFARQGRRMQAQQQVASAKVGHRAVPRPPQRSDTPCRARFR